MHTRKEKGEVYMSLKEKVKQLKVGQEFKSYRAVCEILGEKQKGGTSKNAQLKEWSRYFNHRKDGNKWVITEIYGNPLDKYDARSLLSGGSDYTEDLQTLILMLVELTGNENNLVITRNNLIMQLGLVNSNYKVGKHYPLGIERLLNVEPEVVLDFFTSTDRNLKRIIESALNKLDKKSLIRWRGARVLKFIGEEETRTATKKEDEYILESERRIMEKLNCNNEGEIFARGLSQTYYNQVMMTLNNDYNLHIEYYFRAYEIIFSKRSVQRELNKLPLDERIMVANRLNNNLKNNLCTNAKNRHRRVFKKIENEKKEWKENENNLGVKVLTLTPIEEARSKKDYVDSTRKLINTTISLEEKDKGDVIIKTHYEVIGELSKNKNSK